MTTFNSLPNETLQRIVDCCHEADQTYRTRMGEQVKCQPKSKPSRLSSSDSDKISQAWGKSCSIISRTSKRLRSLAAKHLFSTLLLAQIDATIFKCSILHSSLRLSFSRLDFRGTYSTPSASDFVLFCQLSPLLPNICALQSLNNQVITTLCGPRGLLPPAWLTTRPTSIDSYLEHEQNRTQLLKLASKVNELDVSLPTEQLEILLQCNLQGFDTLRVVAKSQDRFSILQGPDTAILNLIAQCSNLKSLTLVEDRQYHADESDDEEADDPVHDAVLDIPYSFAPSLVSLFLRLDYQPYQVTFNELRFIALFPSLQHLSLTSGWGADENNELDLISLPHLTTLDISCPFGISDGLDILEKLVLPSISSLHIKALKCAVQDGDVDALAKLLRRWNVPKLRNLGYESLPPLYGHEVATLQTATGSPLLVWHQPKTLLQGVREPTLPRTGIFDTSYDQAERILVWTSSYAKRLRESKDEKATKELLGSMKELEERMEWLMD